MIMMMVIITGTTYKEREEEEASHWPPNQESWCKTKRKTRCQDERGEAEQSGKSEESSRSVGQSF